MTKEEVEVVAKAFAKTFYAPKFVDSWINFKAEAVAAIRALDAYRKKRKG